MARICQGGGLNALVDPLCFGFRLILLEQRSGGRCGREGILTGVKSPDKGRLREINRRSVLKVCRGTILLYLSSHVRDTVSECHARMTSCSISFTEGKGDVGVLLRMELTNG